MLPAAWTFKPEIVSHKGGLYRFWNSLLDWQCSIQAKTYSPRRDPGRVILPPANQKRFWGDPVKRGDGERFVVRADELLTAFMELEKAIHQFAVALIA
jgi:hypothetical protein